MLFDQRITRLMDAMPLEHPIDPILKEIVVRCLEESSSLTDAAASIGQGFASLSERCDMVQALIASQLGLLMERR